MSACDHPNAEPQMVCEDCGARWAPPVPETWDEADNMCPNCVTPWKCNGPHLSEETVAAKPVPPPAAPGLPSRDALAKATFLYRTSTNAPLPADFWERQSPSMKAPFLVEADAVRAALAETPGEPQP
jgi:hypothetical protein